MPSDSPHTSSADATLQMWNKSLETVTALETVQAYSINADHFLIQFKDHPSLLERIRWRVAKTVLRMRIDDPEAPTDYGRPLQYLKSEEAKREETLFDQKLNELRRTMSMLRQQQGSSSNLRKVTKSSSIRSDGGGGDDPSSSSYASALADGQPALSSPSNPTAPFPLSVAETEEVKKKSIEMTSA